MKHTIRLTERNLRNIIKESIRKINEEQSISHGTMRPQDVSSALLDFLKQNHPDVYDEFAAKHPNMVQALDNENDPYWDSEESAYDLNDDLWDTMDKVAPKGESFGAHPGDGSDYGYWKNEELDEAVRRAIRKYLR